jgi:hypothetical protein
MPPQVDLSLGYLLNLREEANGRLQHIIDTVPKLSGAADEARANAELLGPDGSPDVETALAHIDLARSAFVEVERQVVAARDALDKFQFS